MDYAALLKPPPFTGTKMGDPEQLLQDFLEYVKTFNKFMLATGVGGEHTADHAACGGCKKAKATLELVGGQEMCVLFEHVGVVTDGDTFKQAVDKVEAGIKAQTNQATARFKLFTKMPQGGRTFAEWYPKVKDQAERCVWTGYDARQAARDAILFQTDSAKLQKKVIAEEMDYDNVIKYGLAFEQGEKKVEQMRAQAAGVRQEQDRVGRLEDKVRQLEFKKGDSKKTCRTCTRGGHDGRCPGLDMNCFACRLDGHMKGSAACKKPKTPNKLKKKKLKDTTRQVGDEAEADSTDSEEANRVAEVHKVRAVNQGNSRHAEMNLTPLDHGKAGGQTLVKLLIDSGVHKTLLSEKDWRTVKKQIPGGGAVKLKVNRTKFKPFGTSLSLPILGRTKCKLRAKAGKEVLTMVYVVAGETESLLGLKDGESLGIIKIKPEGEQAAGVETVAQMYDVAKQQPRCGVISGEQTQDQIDRSMQEIVGPHMKVFQGIGQATVEPVHIEIDSKVKPVQQKRRPIAIHYRERFQEHLEELYKAGVVSGPLTSESARGWIHNVVITQKSWTSKKIRVNLDTRPMKDAVKTTHFPIPTPQELRHNFAGSDRFSVIDLNHAFHQFRMDEASQELFVFYTPWGLYKYNTLVMGVSSASSECHERIRLIVEGLEGVQQIKDDIVVHGQGQIHDARLKALLERLEEYNITLRKEKCQFGVPEVKWFGHIYSEQGMAVDPERKQFIKDWKRPVDKKEVKSFLQTVAFCKVFMRPSDGRTYADVTGPLRQLTSKHTRFKWTEQCEASFQELKSLLISDRVMANYDPTRRTRVFVDDGPTGLGSTVAQEYTVEEVDHPVWRPVNYTGRAKTEAELHYGKVDGESLGIMSGVLSNTMYLYGTKFDVVVDHLPLVPMYNNHSKSLPARVAKHKSKLRAFDFNVIYEAGTTTPSDYGSRHPPPARQYTELERETFGVETEEEDAEIIIARLDMVADAVTLPILARYTSREYKQLLQDVTQGHMSQGTSKLAGIKECFLELSENQGIILRGERLLIPTKLRPDVMAAAHEGCPGGDAMLRQLRLDVWWPGMDKEVKLYTKSCLECSAATPTTSTPPMIERETPDRVWSEVQADFKGPVAGRYYFHVVIDQLSRWPEVEVVTSTSFEKLKPALERSWGLLGIPDQVTHDNGPPYNSQDWKDYAREKGFKLNPCTPEHPRANGIAERFMGVLVKTVHAAVAAGKDPQAEVQRRLLNYRNTPHPSTGKTPSEMIMLRRMKTKIPAIMKPSDSDVHKEGKKRDKTTRADRKKTFDKKHRVREEKIQPGDRVLIKQQKTTIKPPFDPKPYVVTEVKDTQVTAVRGQKVRVRNKAKVKLLTERPEHLKPTNRDEYRWDSQEEDEEDDWFITLPPAMDPIPPPDQEEGAIQLEEQEQEEEQGQEVRQRPVRGARQPIRYTDDRQAPQHLTKKQTSPRERRKRQAMAAKTPTVRQEQRRQVVRLRPPGSIRTDSGWRRETWSTEEDQD